MEQDEQDLEEGEIEGDSDGGEVEYTPLERPKNYALAVPLKRFPEVSTRYSDNDDEDESQSSHDDSDSDTSLRAKQSKKIKLKPLPKRQDRSKKYDVWSTRAQEDVLAETMISCDVSLRDRSRDVESYDYTIAQKYYAELENKQHGTKRTRDNMKSNTFLPKKRDQSEEEEFNGAPREISDLIVNSSNSVEEIVEDIASKLHEKRDDLILKVVQAMGKQKAIEIFKETRQIEIKGGMPIMNQTRRRTSGGIFLYLVRTDYHITPEQKKLIFDEERQIFKETIKAKKKKKHDALKKIVQKERTELLPDLLTRAELYANRNVKTEEENCTNPPPSPESDHQESAEIMEPQILPVKINENKDVRAGDLKTYDDDFLDISLCDNDMDLF
ncbi:unnamed protein product [Ceutorhynchus assimilis]|uniref:Phosphorylated adapter RNA export protein n=1 Tax=Ceutorhynchus assimilis TaxID=467358 RepID=A0A9N9MMW6_9CUCU|nr:unnamed protein product [Ceutorhynchus assimilis]